MKTLCLLTATLLLAACATAPLVATKTEVSTKSPLSGYQSYSWLDKPPSNTPLGRQRVVADIDAQLSLKGWVVSENADVAIVANVATRQKQSTKVFYSQGATRGWGLRPFSSGRINSPMPPTTTVHIDKIGILTINLVDTKRHKIVWRGKTEVTIPISSDRLHAAIDAGIEQLFSEFPAVAKSNTKNPG